MILFEESERFRDSDNYIRQGNTNITCCSYAVLQKDSSHELKQNYKPYVFNPVQKEVKNFNFIQKIYCFE